MSAANLKELPIQLQMLLDITLDPVCLLNSKKQIIHFNPAMKAILKITKQDLTQGLAFCDRLKLAACKDQCQLDKVLQGETVRLDEAPAELQGTKLRIMFKAIPVHPGNNPSNPPTGILLTLRDVTAETVLQAKYTKALELLKEKEVQIADLQTRLNDVMRAAGLN